jgi:DNA replication protein DnaC
MSYSDRHYGAGEPDCPTCGGVGYISYDVPEEHPNFGKVFDCKCRGVQTGDTRQAYLRRISGLANLADKTLDSFHPEGVALPPKHRENLRWAYERVAAFANQPEGWLILVGGHGSGKTHLAAAIANARVDAGASLLYINVPDLLDYLRAAFNPSIRPEEGFNVRFEEVKTTPLLILDDLGSESSSAWANEKLYQILNYRYTAHLPTVITTNQSLESMEAGLRSRLTDMDLSQIVSIAAPDYRGRGVGARRSGLKGLDLYANLTFDTFLPRPELSQKEQENLRYAFEIAKAYAVEPIGWLIFLGTYGSGKTHLAAAIANAQVERAGSPDGIFVTVPDLLDHLRAAFAPNVQMPYDKRFEEIKTSPLLILDNLLVSSHTPWVHEKLHQIVDYRYTGQLPTVITSSHKLEELEKLDLRLATRLRDKRLCRIVAIAAPAYLGKKVGERG